MNVALLFSNDTSPIQSEIAHVFQGIPCGCASYKKQASAVFQKHQDHVLIRHAHQWAVVLPPYLLPVVLQKARNATLPDEEFISASCEMLVSSLQPFVRGHQPLLSNDTLADLLRQYFAEVLEHNTSLDNRKLEETNLILQGLHPSSAVWDKQPCHLHAVCSIHSDVSLAQLTVMCPDFSLLGVETSKGGAEMFIMNSTLQSARTSGILDFANCQRLWPKDLLDQKSIEAFVFFRET